MAVKDRVGAYGERMAERHLVRAGMVVLDRNWRCRTREVVGEIDLVLRDGGTLVFCEVKTRTGTGHGLPAEAVGRAKAQRLRLLALAWLAQSRLRAPDIRFDVVAILVPPGGEVQIDHLRGALG
jgi:putative endonuclease